MRRFWNPLSDATEWYFPNRLVLDVAAARTDTQGTPYEQLLPVKYTAAITLPLLGISAQNGITTAKDFEDYAQGHIEDLTLHTLNGAAHLDVTFARSDAVARWIVEWLQQHQD